MSEQRIDALMAMLERGQDSPLVRYSLGTEYLRTGDAAAAAGHFRAAVDLDGDYSAAWKQLGRALAELGRDDEAIAAYREGIDVAGRKGDRQAAKEMSVFLKRLLKKQGG